MGYDIHITRAEDWAENEDCWIPPEEWDAVVRADAELRLCPENGDHFTDWVSDEAEENGWLDWHEGNVYTKNPSEALIRKMCRIAAQLDANVQGDDGERYPEALEEPEPPRPRSLATYSLILSAVALGALALGFWMDSGHQPGVPRPLDASSLVIIAAGILGVLGLLIGALLAAGSWFTGPKNRLLSLVATASSAAVFLFLYLHE